MPSKTLRAEKKKIDQIEIAPDPVEVAEEAGLRYVSDDRPGYTRKRKGGDFDYLDSEGKPIRDENRLLRIKRIGVPPAYTNVWICPAANGHIQATGRDAGGNSTATTSAGAKSATKISTTGCSFSAKPSRKSAAA
jgi:DNA topoisomerase IB